MSGDEHLTLNDRVLYDFESIKNDFQGLTNAQRRLILKEYVNKVGDYDISVTEYQKFLRLFDDLMESVDDRP
jgi:hypothetical protein